MSNLSPDLTSRYILQSLIAREREMHICKSLAFPNEYSSIYFSLCHQVEASTAQLWFEGCLPAEPDI